jgi:hypothetical protein
MKLFFGHGPAKKVDAEAVPQTESETVKWYRTEAGRGDADAMCNLGGCYESGDGVPQDDVTAYMWFSLAAAKDNVYASFRDRVRVRMTPEQVAEAQKLIAAHSEKKPSSE